MAVFVQDQGIKTVHAGGGGVKKCQNSFHVVGECPTTSRGLAIESEQISSIT